MRDIMDRLDELNYPRNSIRSLDTTNKSPQAVFGMNDDFLNSHGFKKIGHGNYSHVYGHPQLNYVLKMFDIKDVCYRNFIALSKSHSDNPHFPKFRGNPIGISDVMVAIRMEILQFQESIEDDEKYRSINSRLNLGRNLDEWLFKDFPHLEDACSLIYYGMSSVCFRDSHDGNIMFRGNIPVIIDPWGTKGA